MTKKEFIRKHRQRYNEFMASAGWQALRAKKFADVRSKCERCGETRRLQVHHKTYVRFGGEELLDDLESLCVWCHSQEHGTDLTQGATHRNGKRYTAYTSAVRNQRNKAIIESRAADEVSRECYGFTTKYPPSIANVPPAITR